MSELRFNKKGTPFVYIRYYDEFGKRREEPLEIMKENRKAAEEFKIIFDAELLKKKKSMSKSPFTTKTLADAFAHYLRNNSKKDKSTINEYNNFFNLFKKTFPADSACTTLNKLNVEAWLTSLHDLTYIKKVRDKSIKNRKSRVYIETKVPYSQNTLFNFNKNLKKFLGFLFEYNYIPYSFKINRDVTTKMQEPNIIIFEDKDIPELFKNLSNKSSCFKLMFYMLSYSGLRPTDIKDIKAEDIFLDREVFRYWSAKANEFRFRPFHPVIIPIIKERLQEIQTGPILEYSSLDAMGRAFRRYLEQLELDKKGYDLRTFRKTFETHAYDNDIPEASAAELMGHSIETAARHYRKISTTKLKEHINKFSLPGMSIIENNVIKNNKKEEDGGNSGATK